MVWFWHLKVFILVLFLLISFLIHHVEKIHFFLISSQHFINSKIIRYFRVNVISKLFSFYDVFQLQFAFDFCRFLVKEPSLNHKFVQPHFISCLIEDFLFDYSVCQ
jgi:hypothetical protein